MKTPKSNDLSLRLEPSCGQLEHVKIQRFSSPKSWGTYKGVGNIAGSVVAVVAVAVAAAASAVIVSTVAPVAVVAAGGAERAIGQIVAG